MAGPGIAGAGRQFAAQLLPAGGQIHGGGAPRALEALTRPRHLVLLLSASHRQSRELFGLVRGFWERLKAPFRGRVSATELCFKHGSRVVSLPCREDTIRGYSGVNLLIIDEAARVPDDLYRAVRPMLAVSGGRLICGGTCRLYRAYQAISRARSPVAPGCQSSCAGAMCPASD